MNEIPDNDEDFIASFSNDELLFGIHQFAQEKLGMTGDEFISKVRAGEPVHHLHKRAQEVADLVSVLDKRAGN